MSEAPEAAAEAPPAEPTPEVVAEAPAPDAPAEAPPEQADPGDQRPEVDQAALDKQRAAANLAHDQLLGENAPDQTEDPLRNYTDVVPVFVAKTVAFIEATCLQHLPHSYYDQYKTELKAALDQL